MAFQFSSEVNDLIRGLPAEELVRKGVADFADGRETLEALLVQIGASRLASGGMPINPKRADLDADRRLYDLLGQTHGNEAHSQYNSLIRELVSFERGLERRNSASER